MSQSTYQQAFTLIELLVVMLIMVTLLGLSAGAWTNTATQSQRIACQDLIASLLQQARNRSQSQGRPITLSFNAAERSITGINQSFLWQQNFNWSIAEAVQHQDPISDHIPLSQKPLYKPILGPSGHAWQFPYAAPESGAQVFLSAFRCIHNNQELPLFKKSNDGFSLECTIKAPPTNSAHSKQIPLLLLSPQGSGDDVSDAIAGLELWKVGQFINDNGFDVKIGDAWVIIGWVHTRPHYPIIDAEHPETKDTWSFFTSDAEGVRFTHNFPQPYYGGSWIKIGLHYRKDTLSLSTNNTQVHVSATSRGEKTFIPSVNQKIDIFVGRHSRAGLRYSSEATIDNASLISINSDDLITFPGHFNTDHNYEITFENRSILCQQNGRNRQTLSIINIDSQSKSFAFTFNGDGSTSMQSFENDLP